MMGRGERGLAYQICTGLLQYRSLAQRRNHCNTVWVKGGGYQSIHFLPCISARLQTARFLHKCSSSHVACLSAVKERNRWKERGRKRDVDFPVGRSWCAVKGITQK